MTRIFYALIVATALAVVACNEASPTSPSVNKATASVSMLDDAAGATSIHKSSATVTVLDGYVFPSNTYQVTKWPNNPTDPPSPSYFVHTPLNGISDPCTAKWSGWHTGYHFYSDNSQTYEWCVQ